MEMEDGNPKLTKHAGARRKDGKTENESFVSWGGRSNRKLCLVGKTGDELGEKDVKIKERK